MLSLSTAYAVPLEGSYSPFDSGRDEVGVRALGMGGAFVAVADDLTAVEWNPAGLAQLEGYHLRLEGSAFSASSAGDLFRFKRPWDPGFTVFITPESRGTSLQPDFAGFGASYGATPWSFFSAVSWARAKDGYRDDVFTDPVAGTVQEIRQSGGLYHLTASHAATWRGRWSAGIAVHGLNFGGLEGTYGEEGGGDVAYAKIFKGHPALDAGLLARPLDGALGGLRIGAAFHGPRKMTFNYSDEWVEDFDADYRHPSWLAAGANLPWRSWRVAFQWEKGFDGELEGLRKSTFRGGFPSIAFPIRYFDVVNTRAGLEWRPSVRFGALRTVSVCAGYATRDQGYELRTDSFLEADRDRVASFGRPLGSMLTWGLSGEAARWSVLVSGQHEESRYVWKTRTFRLRFGFGARL
jgi:hypothetical protein